MGLVGKGGIILNNLLGLDTETINGYCRLLCLSDGSIFRINNRSDVISFFKGFAKNKKTHFLCWNADFDIQSLLKYFPKRTLDFLLRGLEIQHEEDGFSFSMQYIPSKYLQFDSNYIFDAYQYYGLKLGVAAQKYLGELKHDVDASKITEKNIYSDKVIEYCKQDALLALKLFTRFRDALPETMKTVKPISNAFYSFAYFRWELSNNKPRWDVNNYFRNAYRGGRFEIYTRGHFKNLYVYDINSAYPYEISKLKGLEGHIVTQSPMYFPDATYSVYHVRVHINDKYVSPLIYRDKGLCVYPVGKYEGYVTKGEFERIREYGPEIVEGLHIFANNKHPFRTKINELYEKKLHSEFPLPFKTIMNSLYGRTAMSTLKFIKVEDLDKDVPVVDFVDVDGEAYVKFEDIAKSNFVYASEITARTRLRLFDLVRGYPDSILMVQTDSVISRKEIKDLHTSSKLGDWKLERWDEAYLIGSGVYFYRIGEEWFGKFRGFNLGGEKVKVILERILSAKSPVVEFQSLKRFSLQEARRLHDEDLGNQILEVSRKLKLNFDRKRVWLGEWKSGADVQRKRIKSLAIYSNTLTK